MDSHPKKTFIGQVIGPRGGTDTRTGPSVSFSLTDWSDDVGDAVQIDLRAEFKPGADGSPVAHVRVYSSDKTGRRRILWCGPLETARPFRAAPVGRDTRGEEPATPTCSECGASATLEYFEAVEAQHVVRGFDHNGRLILRVTATWPMTARDLTFAATPAEPSSMYLPI